MGYKERNIGNVHVKLFINSSNKNIVSLRSTKKKTIKQENKNSQLYNIIIVFSYNYGTLKSNHKNVSMWFNQ